MKKFLAILLVFAMMISLAIPAMSNNANVTAEMIGNGKNAQLFVTVNGVTDGPLDWANNNTYTYAVNGYNVTVTIKGNSVSKVTFEPIVVEEPDTADEPIAFAAAAAAAPAPVEPTPGYNKYDDFVKVDTNNAQFHCNAESGNGRVWPAGMKKYEGPMYFISAGGTKWYLVDPVVECPNCGSTDWISFSNNSGVPDGKNIQLQHPAPSIIIEKIWEDGNLGNLEATFSLYKAADYFADPKGAPMYSNLKHEDEVFLLPGEYVIVENPLAGDDDEKYVIPGAKEFEVTGEEGTQKITFINDLRNVFGDTDIFLKKMLQVGTEIKAWDPDHPYYDPDNDYIFFDLYFSDAAGTKGRPVLKDGKEVSAQVDGDFFKGYSVYFGSLLVNQYYFVQERIDFDAAKADLADKKITQADLDRLYKYLAVPGNLTSLPSAHFKAVSDTTNQSFNFNPYFTDEEGVRKQRSVILSTDKDEALDSSNGTPVVINLNVKAAGSNCIVTHWKAEMRNYDSDTDSFFSQLSAINLNGNAAEFIWNTDVFNTENTTGDKELDSDDDKLIRDKAYYGDTVVYTKTLPVFDTLTDSSYTPLEANDGKEIPFYITGDNAFILYVNDELVPNGWSKALKKAETVTLPAKYDLDSINEYLEERDNTVVYGEVPTWAKVYKFNIRDYLRPNQDNIIRIVAVNEACDDQGYHDNPNANPAGFIFGCEVYSLSKNYRFVNELPEDPTFMAALSLEKTVEGESIIAWATGKDIDLSELEFYAYPVTGNNAPYDVDGLKYPKTGPATVDLWTGSVDFGDVPAGWYAIVEELGALAGTFRTPIVQYFEVIEVIDETTGLPNGASKVEKGAIDWGNQEAVSQLLKEAYAVSAVGVESVHAATNQYRANRAFTANSLNAPDVTTNRQPTGMTGLRLFNDITYKFGVGEKVYDVFYNNPDETKPDITIYEITWNLSSGNPQYIEAAEVYLLNVERKNLDGTTTIVPEMFAGTVFNYSGTKFDYRHRKNAEGFGFSQESRTVNGLTTTDIKMPENIVSAKAIRLVDVTEYYNTYNYNIDTKEWYYTGRNSQSLSGTVTGQVMRADSEGFDVDAIKVWYAEPTTNTFDNQLAVPGVVGTGFAGTQRVAFSLFGFDEIDEEDGRGWDGIGDEFGSENVIEEFADPPVVVVDDEEDEPGEGDEIGEDSEGDEIGEGSEGDEIGEGSEGGEIGEGDDNDDAIINKEDGDDEENDDDTIA